MRATFYEALEVPSTAESSAVRAALRAILRRYWSVPRDPSGDTEEAVRFVALGSAILGDEQRRAEYDAQARRGVTTNPWRVGNDGAAIVGADMNALGLPGSHGAQSDNLSVAIGESRLLPAVHALTDPLPEKTEWESAPAMIAALLVALCALGFAYWWLAPLFSTLVVAALLVGLLVVGTIIGVQLRIATNELSGFTLARLVVTKWRRESSVFIGNPAPAQDTAWIFRLRVMELTRSAAGYSSAPNMAIRAFARLTDYAIVALALVLLLKLTAWLFALNADVIAILTSPLVLPILTVLLAIPLEAISVSARRRTPGKYLMGVVVVLASTQPDDCAEPTRSQLSFRRAVSVASSGLFFGFWPLLLARLNAIEKALRVTEGSWESAGDSVVVTRAAPSPMRAAAVVVVLAVATGVFALWWTDALRLAERAKLWLPSTASVPTPQSSAPAVPPPTLPAPVPAAVEPLPPQNVATPSDRQSSVVAPSKSANSLPSNPPTTVTPPPPAIQTSEFERQTALAQARRARIDAAEKRAAAARSSGSYAGLQGVCERWTEDQPGSAEAWRCLGLARAQAGGGRDALPALRQALKLDPNDAQVEAAIFKILRP